MDEKPQVFNALDKALLMRTARHLEAAAELERTSYEVPNGWAASAESREAKRRYDRLLRDARDLRALAKRLTRVQEVLSAA